MTDCASIPEISSSSIAKRRVALASDHAGFALKAEIREHLRARGFDVNDFGAHGAESVDYPAYAAAVARAVRDVNGAFECGVLVCGTGLGMSIAANKFSGIRCAVCSEPYSARLARQHNNANILALGARVVGIDMAKDIVDAYLNARFELRHQRRLDQIKELERAESCGSSV
ncbi:MAG: ribose 5-phosphate isomerase B [Oscillospiraceae bacterium]|jgi:ribose 5-phosphate isomerase B|nr:ribose 5-phosphate isomerase B [Oscillospiraceae bacterium]